MTSPCHSVSAPAPPILMYLCFISLLRLNHVKNRSVSFHSRIPNSLKNHVIHKFQILIYSIDLNLFFYGAAFERMFKSRCLCAIIRQCRFTLSLHRCTRGGRRAKNNFRPSHILLIFSSEPPRNLVLSILFF